MSTDHGPILERVFSDVVERMAFMFADRLDSSEVYGTISNGVRVHMTFTGPINGSVAIAVPGEMCAEIAANALGVEPAEEGAQEKGYDALKELLNVVTGNLLPELAGPEPVFDLSMPDLEHLDAEGWKSMQQAPGTRAFLVDDHPTLVQLNV